MNPTADMSSNSGLSNPAHNPADDIQLQNFTPTDPSRELHNNDAPTSAQQRQKISNGQTPENEGSEVFGLCCSSSGRVPVSRKAEVSDDATTCDVREEEEEEDDEDERKKGHSALEKELRIEYSVTDVPPVHMCLLFGLQVNHSGFLFLF